MSVGLEAGNFNEKILKFLTGLSFCSSKLPVPQFVPIKNSEQLHPAISRIFAPRKKRARLPANGGQATNDSRLFHEKHPQFLRHRPY